MKKPWVVGLLSIVPGLGLILLGQVIPGLGVMAGMSLLFFLFLTTTSTDLSTWLFVFALIFWMLQLGYAVFAAMVAAAPKVSPEKIAQREARRSQREATAIQRSARDALKPLLPPDRHLRIALDGLGGVDARIMGELLLRIIYALGGGTVTDGSDRPTTYIGITEDELVFATTRRIPSPSSLRRVPLSDVSLVEVKEGRLGFDKLTIRTGKRKLLRIYTAKSLRPTIQELGTILSH